MSLTDKEKDAALECFERIFPRHGDEFCVDMGTIPASKAAEVFDLFLSRIREEQETRKGYECVHCGMIYPDHPVSACDCLEAGQKQGFHEVVISRVTPTAPCNCKELVEALERWSYAGALQTFENREQFRAEAAELLANHAKRMKGY